MSLSRRSFTLATAGIAATFAGSAFATEGDDTTIGAASAPLHLIEYASLTCPHCAHFHETNWSQLKTNYIDAGRVKLTLRELLTPPHAVSLAMFQLARCGGVAPPEYFRRVAILFGQQRAILATGTVAGVRDSLVAIGGQWGISQEQVLAALNDPAGVERIRRSIDEASQRGVTGTPAFFFNGQAVPYGDVATSDGLRQALDTRL